MRRWHCIPASFPPKNRYDPVRSRRELLKMRYKKTPERSNQMLSSCIARFMHVGRTTWAAEKSLLATLRKKTGYTFSNCKKALELHNNDIVQAEKWLKDQAQSMGWSKATKLEGRQTSQGLVAAVIDKNNGALVEVNCETDFVARNKHFQEMVENAARACLEFTNKQKQATSTLMKMGLDAEQLKSLPSADGKTLGDHLALMIGTVGENASLRRAFCFKGNSGVKLTCYVHPSSNQQNQVMVGKFGALLAYKAQENEEIDKICRQICQHIVGMNPAKIGCKDDVPAKNSDDEKCLIYQDFVVDESVKVGEVLRENGIEIVGFKRIECGVQDEVCSTSQPLEHVEMCQ